ncbi:hypothetical protein HDU98_006569 [Podochytrium sp. JEL0797]|nr:hypothetical protein HDU98_006569 [Podochytrium sp. JEL0797]
MSRAAPRTFHSTSTSEDDQDDDEVYAALASSERIVDGNVSLDWRSLPPSVRSSVPGAPSAVKQSAILRRESVRKNELAAASEIIPPGGSKVKQLVSRLSAVANPPVVPSNPSKPSAVVPNAHVLSDQIRKSTDDISAQIRNLENRVLSARASVSAHSIHPTTTMPLDTNVPRNLGTKSSPSAEYLDSFLGEYDASPHTTIPPPLTRRSSRAPLTLEHISPTTAATPAVATRNFLSESGSLSNLLDGYEEHHAEPSPDVHASLNGLLDNYEADDAPSVDASGEFLNDGYKDVSNTRETAARALPTRGVHSPQIARLQNSAGANDVTDSEEYLNNFLIGGGLDSSGEDFAKMPPQLKSPVKSRVSFSYELAVESDPEPDRRSSSSPSIGAVPSKPALKRNVNPSSTRLFSPSDSLKNKTDSSQIETKHSNAGILNQMDMTLSEDSGQDFSRDSAPVDHARQQYQTSLRPPAAASQPKRYSAPNAMISALVQKASASSSIGSASSPQQQRTQPSITNPAPHILATDGSTIRTKPHVQESKPLPPAVAAAPSARLETRVPYAPIAVAQQAAKTAETYTASTAASRDRLETMFAKEESVQESTGWSGTLRGDWSREKGGGGSENARGETETVVAAAGYTFHDCKFVYSLPGGGGEGRNLVVGMAGVMEGVKGVGVKGDLGAPFETGEVDPPHNEAETESTELDLTISDLSSAPIPQPQPSIHPKPGLPKGPGMLSHRSSSSSSSRAYMPPHLHPQSRDKISIRGSSLRREYDNSVAANDGSRWMDDRGSDSVEFDEVDVDRQFLEEENEEEEEMEDFDEEDPNMRNLQPSNRNSTFFKKPRKPLSFRPSEATLKKRHHELDLVNAELVQLSKIIGDKRDELRHRESVLSARESAVSHAQEQIEAEVHKLLSQRSRARDAFLKKEVAAILQESDASVAVLAKENRRLVASNKELVSANRRLRDQMVEAVEKSELKDRMERLKKSMNTMKPSHLVIERHAPVALGHGLDLSGHGRGQSKVKQANVSTQTNVAVVNHPPPPLSSRNETPKDSELAQLVLILLRTHFLIQQADELGSGCANIQSIVHGIFAHNSAEIFKPLSHAISSLSIRSADSEQEASLYSLFLTFVIEFVRCLAMHSEERDQLSKSACAVLISSSEPGVRLTMHARLSLQLIVLAECSNVSRTEMILADLVNLMSSSDEAKMMFLGLFGIDLVHPIMALDDMSPTGKILASAVLLAMCAEGHWNEEFLDQCVDSELLMGSLATCCCSSKGLPEEFVGVYENVLVLLQKMSRIPKTQTQIRGNEALYHWIQNVCESNDPMSEFMKLNAVSIWQNLG